MRGSQFFKNILGPQFFIQKRTKISQANCVDNVIITDKFSLTSAKVVSDNDIIGEVFALTLVYH